MSKRKVRIDNGDARPFYISEDDLSKYQAATPWWARGWVLWLVVVVAFLVLGIPLTGGGQ